MTYKIYMTQGQGMTKEPVKEVSNLKDAVKYIDERRGEGSWAIKCPNGKWYRWE